MRSSDRWERVAEVLERAVEVSGEKRAEFLEWACEGDSALRSEVESLLAANDQAADFLAAPTVRPERVKDGISTGSRIGPYLLMEIIGEGGTGTVFLARQDAPLKRLVAVKVIKAGMDTRQVVARFELERQALALMDHPNIAKVFDAGSTQQGRPYFVMELVKGKPITEYVKEKQMPLEDRLALFVTVCGAVQHAHQKGVIHRDLKPGNVLVTEVEQEPVAKVIDFGIAKALSADVKEDFGSAITMQPQFLGTPQYMSPEQAAFEPIDARSDVYSLGAMLYELVTDAPPFDAKTLGSTSFGEMHRLLREAEPVRMSDRIADPVQARQVRGELEWIVAKAMAKEVAERYDSAAALGDDVEHFLKNEPVSAARGIWLYRSRKFVRRHTRIVSISASIALAMVLAVILVTWMSPPEVYVATTMPVRKEPGLLAEYYTDPRFRGSPTTRKVEADVNHIWHSNQLPVVGKSEAFSVRWKGIVVVPTGGVSAFGISADDGARLWIDGRLCVQFRRPHKTFVRGNFAPGPHPIQIEMWNDQSMARAHLLWVRGTRSPETVPAEALFHGDEEEMP